MTKKTTEREVKQDNASKWKNGLFSFFARIKTTFGLGAKVFARGGKIISRLVWLFPPIIVAIAMLWFLKARGFYPFGDITISWGDLDQQTMPLLLDYKRILSGEEGFFLNTKAAGGMNFFGVFFFFISSPFAFLVIFVDESKVALFVNILVMLKMCAIACTASVYFYKKHPNAPFLNIALSVLYAFSGYVMYYYQNMMWLDVMCLFPLLLLALDDLKKGKRAFFIIILTACLFANFYLAYMIVVFLLLYVLMWLLISKNKKFATDFILTCAVAALLSSIVWMPSLVHYFSSGRKGSIIENLQNSGIFTSYTTTFPSIFSVLFLFPFAFSKVNSKTQDGKLRFVLFLLSLIPIVFEPINKMWQTGSYMSFPTRYAFIPIFLCLTLAMDCLVYKQENEEKQGDPKELLLKQKVKKQAPRYALSLVLLAISVWYLVFAIDYTRANREIMDQYAHSLWGNSASFEALLKLYVLAIAIGVLCYLTWKCNFFKPILLWTSIAVLAFSELYVAPNVYMRAASHSVERHLQIMELADKIEDEGFYRVKSHEEYSGYDFDVNMMGGIGYHALGHYTSLTNVKYMTAMKLFGYTSYWMEVGNSGGTILSDALMSVKYSIKRSKNGGDVYQGTAYGISKTPHYLPLGIITQADIIKEWEESDGVYPRATMQKRLAQDFFGDSDFVQTYNLKDATLNGLTVEEVEGKYLLTPQGSKGEIVFNVTSNHLQYIYFNAFDENNNQLNQAINKKFSIKTSKYSLSQYPTQKRNGLLSLGEYKGTTKITVTVTGSVTVRDVSVVAIDSQALGEEIERTQTVGLTSVKNGYDGRYTAQGGECVFLSVAHDEGFTLRINGKKAQLHEVYDGFMAFYLKEGENKIEIRYCSPGFVFGACTTLIGVGLCAAACVLWIWKKRRIAISDKCDIVTYYVLLTVGAAVVCLVYLMPLVLCAV